MWEKVKAFLVKIWQKIKPYWPWIVGGLVILIVGIQWGWKLAGWIGGGSALLLKGGADVVTPAKKKVETIEDKQKERKEKADAIRKGASGK